MSVHTVFMCVFMWDNKGPPCGAFAFAWKGTWRTSSTCSPKTKSTLCVADHEAQPSLPPVLMSSSSSSPTMAFAWNHHEEHKHKGDDGTERKSINQIQPESINQTGQRSEKRDMASHYWRRNKGDLPHGYRGYRMNNHMIRRTIFKVLLHPTLLLPQTTSRALTLDCATKFEQVD
mmetsp:Transcript_21140/g.58831  ORF Transcript_21140/g.58831 Transcript_21140/m.58831 type:complete len:175 (-) Transcript_21140:546-1070(-)